MTSHVLVGPEFDIQKVGKIFKNKNNDFRIYGNGGKYIIDCKVLNLPNNANVIIQAHGLVDQYGHFMSLCSTSEYTRDSFKEISNGKVLNVELFSCFGGAAIKEIEYLPQGSTLMTFISADSSSAAEMDNDIQNSSLNFKYSSNPFIKFASYIFINPDTVQFAIKSGEKSNIFTAEIYSLVDTMKVTEDIRIWQLNQLDNFIIFCKNIQSNINKRSLKQIKELFKLYEDQNKLEDWLEQFNINRYKELLFMNMQNRNDLNALDKILEMDVNINAQVNAFSPLRLAAQEGNNIVIDMLLKNGVDVNSAFGDDGLTALHTASDKGHTDTVVKLLSNGANINAMDSGGLTALLFALRTKHDQVASKLIELGANVNIISDTGATALQLAFFYREDKKMMVKLLAAGADTSVEIEKGLKILDYASYSESTAKIAKEIKLYNKSPVTYILKHNNKADLALNAIQNLKQQSQFNKLLLNIEKTEYCLEEQPKESILDLDYICGKNGIFYQEDIL